MSTLTELLLAPGVFSLGAAAVMGAGHALTPGHGKTVVAAYLAGTRGSAMDALRLGVIVTFTHTASVFVLGLLAHYAGESVDLREWQPVIARASGILIALMGVWLLVQRLRPVNLQPLQSVAAQHGHVHATSLNAMGISGGIVPCADALGLLVIALSRGQSLYGLALLMSFSVGLAIVLVGLGLVAVFLTPQFSRFERLAVVVPIMSALLLIVLGVALAL